MVFNALRHLHPVHLCRLLYCVSGFEIWQDVYLTIQFHKCDWILLKVDTPKLGTTCISLIKTMCEQKYALHLAVKLTDCLRILQQLSPDLWVRVTNNLPKSGSWWPLDLWARIYGTSFFLAMRSILISFFFECSNVYLSTQQTRQILGLIWRLTCSHDELFEEQRKGISVVKIELW